MSNYYLQLYKYNNQCDSLEELINLDVKCNNYNEALNKFKYIFHNYTKCNSMEILIDLVDDNFDIYESYSLSFENARHLLMRNGIVPKF